MFYYSDNRLIECIFLWFEFIHFFNEIDFNIDRSFPLQALAFRGAGGEPPQLRLRGLTCPAIPAGVKCLPLQSTLC